MKDLDRDWWLACLKLHNRVGPEFKLSRWFFLSCCHFPLSCGVHTANSVIVVETKYICCQTKVPPHSTHLSWDTPLCDNVGCMLALQSCPPDTWQQCTDTHPHQTIRQTAEPILVSSLGGICSSSQMAGPNFNSSSWSGVLLCIRSVPTSASKGE